MLVPLWLRRLAAIERALLSSCPLARTLNGEHSKPYHFPLMVRLRPIGHVLPHFFISGHFKSPDNESAMMTRPDFANLTREKPRNRGRGARSPSAQLSSGLVRLVLLFWIWPKVSSFSAGGGLNAFLTRAAVQRRRRYLLTDRSLAHLFLFPLPSHRRHTQFAELFSPPHK